MTLTRRGRVLAWLVGTPAVVALLCLNPWSA